MDEIRSAGIVLAALELTPGEPSDLTALLREPAERRALLPGEATDNDAFQPGAHGMANRATDPRPAPRRPLTYYLADHLDQGRVEFWEKVVERGVRDGRYRPMVFGSHEYPERLACVWDAPPILFRSIGAATIPTPVNGSRHEHSIAIVGGREAPPDVLAAAADVASAVASLGIRVVSGLAAGVDTAAHRGALRVDGLTTAVMGTGIELVFPDENRDLADQIAQRGILMSQFAPSAPRTGTTFLRRNCVIAAMTDVSLIMYGRARSGSRHEVDQALRYGRRVYMWGPALRGESWAHELTVMGSSTFVDSAPDLVAQLNALRS